MSKHRYNCKFCGHGFLAKPWDKNGQRSTCKRARCEKKAGIYEKPVWDVQLPEKVCDDGSIACMFDHDHTKNPQDCLIHN